MLNADIIYVIVVQNSTKQAPDPNRANRQTVLLHHWERSFTADSF